MGRTNLDEQYTFYASYHRNTINKLIHVLFVWPIIWSGLVLFQYVPYEITLNPPYHPINLSLLITIYYAVSYVMMDKRAGSAGALLVTVSLITGRKFFVESFSWTGYPAWQVALAIQVVAWGSQFIGHGVFEKRAPALVDNFFQALLMGGIFIVLEVMFAFGYRKEFQVEMRKSVEQEIARIKALEKK